MKVFKKQLNKKSAYKQYVKIILQLAVTVFITILLFAFAYWLLEFLLNESLSPKAINFGEYIYFSSTTLSSLGYGDFAPIGYSRILSGIEVFSGLAILGVFISRFVSLKQEIMIELLVKTDCIRGYDKRLASLQNSREVLSDMRRRISNDITIDPGQFELKYNNPFYETLKSVKNAISYNAYICSSHNIKEFYDRLASLAWELERLLGILRKLTIKLNNKNEKWNNKTNTEYIIAMCNSIDGFLSKNKNQISESFDSISITYRKRRGIRLQKFDVYMDVIKKQIKAIELHIDK